MDTRAAFIQVYHAMEAAGVNEDIRDRETATQAKAFKPDAQGVQRHEETNETAVEWGANLRARKPFWFDDYVPPELSMADEMRRYVKAVEDNHTLESIRQLYKHCEDTGQPKGKADEIIRAMGLEIKPDRFGKLKPPKNRLTIADDGTTTVNEPKTEQTRRNPWLKEYWNVTAQGSIIKASGREVASQIAAAAGSYIGATKPTR
jgi:hypothetical protein